MFDEGAAKVEMSRTKQMTGELTAAFMSCYVLICFACSSSSGLFSLSLHLYQWAFDFILDEPGIAPNLGGCGD
jgi:hypothetical protein